MIFDIASRNKNDIRKCIEILVDQNADNVFSVAPARNNPYFNMVEVDEKNKVRLIKHAVFILEFAISLHQLINFIPQSVYGYHVANGFGLFEPYHSHQG